MARRRKAEKRITTPDCIYNNVLVQKLINRIMLSGKKTTAQKIVYKALEFINSKTGSPINTLEQAKENARPKAELKSIKLGGTNIAMPTNIGALRSESLFLTWTKKIVNKHKKGKAAHSVLATLILDASKNQGQLIKKKEDTHKMAEANKAYATQYRSV